VQPPGVINERWNNCHFREARACDSRPFVYNRFLKQTTGIQSGCDILLKDLSPEER
jgi:hypothetical protein